MKRLSDELLERETSHPLWIVGGRELSVGDVRGGVAALRSALRDLWGADLALVCQDPAKLALLLVALDGFAGRILLAPPPTPGSTPRAWLAARGCEHFRVLSDDPAASERTLVFESLLSGSPRRDEPDVPTAVPPVTQWLIATSGTSGIPKLVAHSLESLTRTTRQGGIQGEPPRWGLVYDLPRFAGLQVFLQSWFGRGLLIFPGPVHDLDSAVGSLVAARCTALSATPSMWRKLLMSAAAAALPLRQITLGGEIADQAILGALARHYPAARIVHIYASTEAGVGFSVRDGQAGFPSAYLEHPPAGISLRIREDGMLLIRPERCLQHYVGEQERLSDEAGWIATGDLVELVGNRIRFLGRANGAINVGGRKVMPEEIEHVLLRVDGVAQACVRARRSSILGSLVEATVVPRPDYEASDVQARAQQACADLLEDFKRPAVLRVVDSIALSSAGKVARP